jgi:hypothetical protein
MMMHHTTVTLCRQQQSIRGVVRGARASTGPRQSACVEQVGVASALSPAGRPACLSPKLQSDFSSCFLFSYLSCSVWTHTGCPSWPCPLHLPAPCVCASMKPLGVSVRPTCILGRPRHVLVYEAGANDGFAWFCLLRCWPLLSEVSSAAACCCSSIGRLRLHSMHADRFACPFAFVRFLCLSLSFSFSLAYPAMRPLCVCVCVCVCWDPSVCPCDPGRLAQHVHAACLMLPHSWQAACCLSTACFPTCSAPQAHSFCHGPS